MPKQIIIAEEHRTAAVFSEDQIQELIVAQGTHQISDIYVGTVENVLPSIEAAFVNIGDSDRNGFIHVSDLGPLRLQRTAGAITELLEPKQKVLVQIMKEPTGNKGPRLTGKITLPGRYLVLMPYNRGVNLSRRIMSEQERSRLRALAILIKPAGMGLLVRTEAEGVSEEAIIEDLEALQSQWENIQQEAAATRPPALLNRDDDFIQRVLRDVYTNDVNRIVVDSHTGLKRVKQHLQNWSSGRIPLGLLIEQHRDRTPILDYFRVNAAIREALKPRVDLPSGGYIIIEPTEALTVVDVNSGSFTRSATARETVLWTNFEAAAEIARQLRLRNLAGVIVVDFIDMDARRDQLKVLEHFMAALKSDKARPQIAQFSELGLVELTRKRQGQNIYELFGRPCATCGGLGHVIQLPGETEPSSIHPSDHRSVSLRARSVSPTPATASVSLDSDWSDSGTSGGDFDSSGAPQLPEPATRRRRRRDNDGPLRSFDKETGESESPAKATSESLPNRNERGNESSSRPSRRSPRQPPKEPDVIAVEMTNLQQDVYAWMGVSPLILTDREVEDPRNVVIQVVQPGELPPSTNGAKTAVSDTAIVSEVAASTQQKRGKNASIAAESVSTADPSPELAVAITTDEVVAETASDEADESAATTGTRRRRRRSSAT